MRGAGWFLELCVVFDCVLVICCWCCERVFRSESCFVVCWFCVFATGIRRCFDFACSVSVCLNLSVEFDCPLLFVCGFVKRLAFWFLLFCCKCGVSVSMMLKLLWLIVCFFLLVDLLGLFECVFVIRCSFWGHWLHVVVLFCFRRFVCNVLPLTSKVCSELFIDVEGVFILRLSSKDLFVYFCFVNIMSVFNRYWSCDLTLCVIVLLFQVVCWVSKVFSYLLLIMWNVSRFDSCLYSCWLFCVLKLMRLVDLFVSFVLFLFKVSVGIKQCVVSRCFYFQRTRCFQLVFFVL